MQADAGLWPAQPNAAEAAKLAAAKKNRYYALLYREMADRKRAEGQLRVNYGLLSALSHAQLRFLSGADLSAVFADLLESLLEITESRFGFIADASCGDDGRPTVTMLACVLPEVSTASREVLTDLAHLVLNRKTCRRPLITSGTFPFFSANGDAPDESVAELLDTYSFLGIPLHGGEAAAGVLALGDRPAGYDAEIVEFLQPAQTACTQMIFAQRMDDQRRKAEAALAEERASLAERVRTRTAELQRVNAELKFAVRARDEFLAMVNHELRTPLNAILLLTEVLHKGIYGEMNEKQQRSVRDIAESGRHLLSLISDILDVSKIEAGKLDLEIAPCAVESICHSSLQLVQGMARKNDIQVSLELAPGIETVRADARRLKQMLVNLLSNAVKFTPPGGSVGLRVVAEEDRAHFTVWDTGIGIAEKDMDKLFQPFVQLDTGHARQYGGSGLGLVLVSNMAKMHGGGVSVESEVGQGSSFTVSLPWCADEAADPGIELCCMERNEELATETKIQAASMHRRLTAEEPIGSAGQSSAAPESAGEEPLILVADDNVPNVDALTEYLSIHSCRLVVAHDGADAIEKARQLRPQLILMDVHMPEVDGIEATRQIRAIENMADIPIVALTASVMPGDRERCLEAGMNGFLGKPVDLDALDQMILRYAGTGREEAQTEAITPSGSG